MTATTAGAAAPPVPSVPPGPPAPSATSRSQAGFSLFEMILAFAILVLCVALAAQLLGEAQQMMVDAAQQALDPAAMEAASRIRTDVLSSTSATATQNPDSSCAALQLSGGPQGTVVYRLDGGALVRGTLSVLGMVQDELAILPGTASLACTTQPAPPATVVLLSYQYRRSRARRSPLQMLPGQWGPRQDQVHESLIVTTRAAGVGAGW